MFRLVEREKLKSDLRHLQQQSSVLVPLTFTCPDI